MNSVSLSLEPAPTLRRGQAQNLVDLWTDTRQEEFYHRTSPSSKPQSQPGNPIEGFRKGVRVGCHRNTNSREPWTWQSFDVCESALQQRQAEPRLNRPPFTEALCGRCFRELDRITGCIRKGAAWKVDTHIGEWEFEPITRLGRSSERCRDSGNCWACCVMASCQRRRHKGLQDELVLIDTANPSQSNDWPPFTNTACEPKAEQGGCLYEQPCSQNYGDVAQSGLERYFPSRSITDDGVEVRKSQATRVNVWPVQIPSSLPFWQKPRRVPKG